MTIRQYKKQISEYKTENEIKKAVVIKKIEGFFILLVEKNSYDNDYMESFHSMIRKIFYS